MPVHDWIARISSISLISSHSSGCERWFWGCFFSEVHPYLQNAFSVFGWLEMFNSICQKNTPHFEPHFLNLQCAAGWNALQQAPPPPPQRKTRSLDTSFFLNVCRWKPGYQVASAVVPVSARNNAAWAVPMHNCPMSRKNSTKGGVQKIHVFGGEQWENPGWLGDQGQCKNPCLTICI